MLEHRTCLSDTNICASSAVRAAYAKNTGLNLMSDPRRL